MIGTPNKCQHFEETLSGKLLAFRLQGAQYCKVSEGKPMRSYGFSKDWAFARGLLHVVEPQAGNSCSVLRVFAKCQMVISQNEGTRIKAPKYYSPYYGEPQIGTPNFGKPPDAVRTEAERIRQSLDTSVAE